MPKSQPLRRTGRRSPRRPCTGPRCPRRCRRSRRTGRCRSRRGAGGRGVVAGGPVDSGSAWWSARVGGARVRRGGRRGRRCALAGGHRLAADVVGGAGRRRGGPTRGDGGIRRGAPVVGSGCDAGVVVVALPSSAHATSEVARTPQQTGECARHRAVTVHRAAHHRVATCENSRSGGWGLHATARETSRASGFAVSWAHDGWCLLAVVCVAASSRCCWVAVTAADGDSDTQAVTVSAGGSSR
jgi:hypothetical protein